MNRRPSFYESPALTAELPDLMLFLEFYSVVHTRYHTYSVLEFDVSYGQASTKTIETVPGTSAILPSFWCACQKVQGPDVFVRPVV